MAHWKFFIRDELQKTGIPSFLDKRDRSKDFNSLYCWLRQSADLVISRLTSKPRMGIDCDPFRNVHLNRSYASSVAQ